MAATSRSSKAGTAVTSFSQSKIIKLTSWYSPKSINTNLTVSSSIN